MKNLYFEIPWKESSTAIYFGGKKLNFQQFENKVGRFSELLKKNGIGALERIGLIGLNPLDLLIAYYGAFKVNIIPVPIPSKDEKTILLAIKTAQLTALVSPGFSVAKTSLKYSVDVMSSEALNIFTSGTSSAQLKAVRLSHANISSACRYMNKIMALKNTDTEAIFAPIDHAYGFGRAHSVLSAGGCVVLFENLRKLSELVNTRKTIKYNGLATPPAVLTSILDGQDCFFQNLYTEIDFIQTGAMRFPVHYRQKLLEKFLKAKIFLHYGLSECMRATFLDLRLMPDKIHTEGRPSQGVEIKIVNDLGLEMMCGQKGRITLRGENLFLGYTDLGLRAREVGSDWFATSDLGEIDSDGFLIFHGRADDVLNVNGFLIHPEEIEVNVSQCLPGRHVCAVGIPDSTGRRDSLIYLCIEGREPAEGLRSIYEKLHGIKQSYFPHKIIFIDKFPRTRSNKIKRGDLRHLIKKQNKV